jgi:hypothetical protein
VLRTIGFARNGDIEWGAWPFRFPYVRQDRNWTRVVFASGTQYPNREAAVMHTADGGQTWNSISMAAHANLLIDTYFVDDLHGRRHGGTTYDKLKPVIMFTADFETAALTQLVRRSPIVSTCPA